MSDRKKSSSCVTVKISFFSVSSFVVLYSTFSHICTCFCANGVVSDNAKRMSPFSTKRFVKSTRLKQSFSVDKVLHLTFFPLEKLPSFPVKGIQFAKVYEGKENP